MAINGLGDLAQSYAMRSHNVRLRENLDNLVTELSTGQDSNIPQRLRGDFSGLSSVSAELSTLDAYRGVLVETRNFANGMQTALDAVQSSLADSGPKLLTAVNPGDEGLLNATLAEAGQRYFAIVSQINSRDGDRSLFAGNAIDRPALAEAETILAGLSTALTGLTTAADIRAAADAWFDTPGGGFDTVAYLGSADPLDPFQISDVDSVTLEMRAQDPELRTIVKDFALAALMDDGLLHADLPERMKLAGDVGIGIVNSERELTLARARIGTEQARIDATEVRNSAEQTSLLTARDMLVGVDPFEAATRLEDAEAQLQILYNVTARLSNLSLAEYLR